MFDDVKQSTEGGNEKSIKPPEDIFESVDKPGVTSSVNSGSQIESAAPTPNSMMTGINNSPSPSSKKKILKLLLLLVIIGIVGISGYLGWQYFSNLKTETNKISEEDNQNNAVNENKEQVIEVSDENKIDDIDTDNDGLLDREEKEYGTDINLPDTDNDGLLDREEVMNYHTNPLLADTDGDGYLDGEEVRAGYNPNGSGKLLPDKPVKFNQ